MPPRKKAPLPDTVRAAVQDRLRYAQESSVRADEDFMIEIYLANIQGMTINEIATSLKEKSSTVGDWKIKGEQAFRSRRRGDTQRPGQLSTNS